MTSPDPADASADVFQGPTYQALETTERRPLTHLQRPRVGVRRLIVGLPLLLLTLARLDAQSVKPSPDRQEPAAMLLDRPGAILEREMQGGEVHPYSVSLAAGQYVHIVIRQLGIDVVPSLFDPRGRKVLESDTPTQNYGSEVVRWVAETDGTYRLEVRSLEKDALPGCYELEWDARRPTTPEDKILVAAEVAFGQAWRFELDQDAKSQRRALEKYQEAFVLFHRGGDPGREALALDCVGSKLAAIGEQLTAIDHFEEALRLSRAAGDAYVEAHILYSMATVEISVGRVSEAIQHYQSALLIERRAGDPAMEAEILCSLAKARGFLGEKDSALEMYGRALLLSRQTRNHDLEIRTLNRLGMLHQSVGEKVEALRSYRGALLLARSGPDRMEEALVLWNIARVLAELGDPETAMRDFNSALEIIRSNEDRYAESMVLLEMGRTRARLSDDAKALDDLSIALPLARAASDPRLEAAVLNASGEILARSGRTDRALTSFEQGLAVTRKAKDPYNEADILTSRGAFLGRLGRLEEGLEDLNLATLLRRSVGDKLGEAEAHYQTALIRRDSGGLQEARPLVEGAIDTVESVRGHVASPELRASFLSSVEKYYELYIDLLMSSDQATGQGELAARALEISERAKARTLLDLLTEAGADIRSGIDTDLLERERSLRQRLQARIERQMRAVDGKQSEKDSQRLVSEIDSLTDELDQVEAEIRETSPRYAALTRPEPLDLAGIQRETLDEGTALLEYALGERQSFLWVVTQHTLRSFVLPPRAQIEHAARRLYALWSSDRKRSSPGGAESVQQEAQALSRMVLGPVSELLGAKRLLIVADGALQLIPFAALPPPRVIGKARSSELLIDAHEIVSLPSASVLALQRRELGSRAPAAKTLAVLADPVFEREDPRLEEQSGRETARGANEPARERGGMELDTASVAGLAASGGGFRISRLPLTRREAEAILRLVSPSDRMEALDFAASVATAKSEEMGNYRYLHFATHGLINSLHPELSGIVLSLFDQDGREQEGFLSTLDVFNLKLPADLVVLSACRTALGKEIRGEGMMGLTRAFMYAGAKRVVASLWKVDDAATAELMTRFYEGILGPQHLTPAAALRRAQITTKRQTRWERASFWAAFTLQGDWN